MVSGVSVGSDTWLRVCEPIVKPPWRISASIAQLADAGTARAPLPSTASSRAITRLTSLFGSDGSRADTAIIGVRVAVFVRRIPAAGMPMSPSRPSSSRCGSCQWANAFAMR
jgi:hypothetical protein